MKIGNRMMAWMSRHMMSCDEASLLISRREDEKIPPARRLSLRLHLFTCHLCRKYAIQIRQLGELMGTYRKCGDDPGCIHHLSENQKDAIRFLVNKELKTK